MNEHDENPLVQEVPGHLLQFEEKIFGMHLSQLLIDLGVIFGIITYTSALALPARIVVCTLFILPSLVLVHWKVGDYTLSYWLYLLVRMRFLPQETVWRRSGKTQQKGELPSVQDCWLQVTEMDHGVMGYVAPVRKEG